MRAIAILFALGLVCIPALACGGTEGESNCAGTCQGCSQFVDCCDGHQICGAGHGSPGLFCSADGQICP